MSGLVQGRVFTASRRITDWQNAVRNSGILPDPWRGHFVRASEQATSPLDRTGRMPELRFGFLK
jgi:hypothetical protein